MLESLKVQVVSVNSVCKGDYRLHVRIFALSPLFTVIPPLNAVVAAEPLIVFDVAPVKVTLPVPPLNVPLF
jgi:hypothetical protein